MHNRDINTGKVPSSLLCDLLHKVKISDQRVILGPKLGEDAALIDFGDKYLVATTDPITFATDLLGWYLVHINSNDIAAMGGTPQWLLTTLLLPEGTTTEQTENIFDQIVDTCSNLNITLIGGHTEVTTQVSSPIAIGTMLGEVDKTKTIYSSGAQLGDSILLTKRIAIEGTAILARESSNALHSAGISDQVIKQAANLLFSPGISIISEANIACNTVDVHAMHDLTEGGLANGIREIALASKIGVEIYPEKIGLIPECEYICSVLSINPMGLIASGSLLIIISPDDVKSLTASLNEKNIDVQEIGRVTNPESGIKLHELDGIVDLPIFEQDELARWYAE